MSDKIEWRDTRPNLPEQYEAVIEGCAVTLEKPTYGEYWVWSVKLPKPLCPSGGLPGNVTQLSVRGDARTRAAAEKWAEQAAKYARLLAKTAGGK